MSTNMDAYHVPCHRHHESQCLHCLKCNGTIRTKNRTEIIHSWSCLWDNKGFTEETTHKIVLQNKEEEENEYQETQATCWVVWRSQRRTCCNDCWLKEYLQILFLCKVNAMNHKPHWTATVHNVYRKCAKCNLHLCAIHSDVYHEEEDDSSDSSSMMSDSNNKN